MAFSSNASGKFQIYALDLRSGEIRQLTADAAENAAPLVAADDRSILFHATKNEANVYSYSLENKKETAHTASTCRRAEFAATACVVKIAFYPMK